MRIFTVEATQLEVWNHSHLLSQFNVQLYASKHPSLSGGNKRKKVTMFDVEA
jgi:hypothetical protein